MFFEPLAKEMDHWVIRRTPRGIRLVDGMGYTYTKDRHVGNKSYWRCDYRLWKCKARASLVGSTCTDYNKGQVLFNMMTHGHPAPFKSPERTEDNETESLENLEMLEPPVLQSILKPRNMPAPKVSPFQDKPVTPADSEMCLRWNSHHANMQSSFPALMDQEQYVDVTLAVEGKLLKCHKLILSSCSVFFDEMLKNTSPHQETVIYLHGMEFWQVKALVDFMYKGEVNVDQPKLESLLKAAEELEVKGLAGKSQRHAEEPEEEQDEDVELPATPATVMKESPERPTTADSPIMEDTQDEEYFPNPELRRKYQVKKRKRKILIPPDPSYLKHVKLNLKGTKSRPNIKQPKFYSPDYPEYDPDRCISPPKLDSDPVFHIDNIKLEPIDIDQDETPNLYEIKAQLDESLTQSKSSIGNKDSSKPASIKTNADATDIEITSTDNPNKMAIETLLSQPLMLGNKKAIIVKCQATKNVIEVSPPVRALPTTERMLKKFATTQLTSILKKELPSVVKKTMKTPIFRQILPKVTSTVTSATSTMTYNQKVVTVAKPSDTERPESLKTEKKHTAIVTNKDKLDENELEPDEYRMDDETDEDIVAD